MKAGRQGVWSRLESIREDVEAGKHGVLVCSLSSLEWWSRSIKGTSDGWSVW